MNQGIFFEILKNASDEQTVLNMCQSYPEYSWESRSAYWLKLIEERFGHSLVPDFKKLYLVYVKRVWWVERFFTSAKKTPKEKRYEEDISFLFNDDLLQNLFAITDPSFKETYYDLQDKLSEDSMSVHPSLKACYKDGNYFLDLYNDDYTIDDLDTKYLVVSSKVSELDLRNFLLQL